MKNSSVWINTLSKLWRINESNVSILMLKRGSSAIFKFHYSSIANELWLSSLLLLWNWIWDYVF